jgi:hypothetical protein
MLRGVMKSGLNGAAVLAIPPGYRPPVDRSFTVTASGGVASVTASAVGTIIASSQTGTVTVWFFLDEIQWDTETVTEWATGAPGNTILNGTAVPTTEGRDGDFYLRTTTNVLYGPKAAGALARRGSHPSWPAGCARHSGHSGKYRPHGRSRCFRS